VGRPLAFNQAIAALGRYSLVTVTEGSLTVHRLVQTVVRDGLSVTRKQTWVDAALQLVSSAFPFLATRWRPGRPVLGCCRTCWL